MRVTTRGRVLHCAAVGLVAALGVSCTKSDTAQPTPAAPSANSQSSDTKPKSSITVPKDAENKPIETKRKKGGKPYTEQVNASIDDIQDYWAETMPKVYDQEYERIPANKIYAASPKKPAPPCGGGQPNYEDVQENAFYCPLGQYVAFDDEQLFPRFYEDYGQFAISFVLAHEWGHAIQDQIGIIDSPKFKTIDLEQQADCFSGAWAAHVAGGSSTLDPTPSDLQSALAGLIDFKDPVGTDPLDVQAHGSGFDRINAFQEGFENGASRCAEYEDPSKRPEVVEIPFTQTDCPIDTGSNARSSSAAEAASCGDMSFEDAVNILTIDLNEYWEEVTKRYNFDFKPVEKRVRYSSETSIPSCGDRELTEDEALEHIFFCVEDNYVGWDDTWLQSDVNDKSANGIGDLATGALLAKQWAVSFLLQEGLTKDEINSKNGELQQSCFTGAWAGDVSRGGGAKRSQQLTLQAGDLDEAVIAFVAYSEEPDDDGNTARGSGFEHVAAFRDGFFNGELRCDAYSDK